MKRLLIIKLTSMGDVIHALPALTDALSHKPNLQVDWLVDAACQAIPRLHPGLHAVLTIPLRQWKRRLPQWGTIRAVWRTLRTHDYDAIIDSQGLFKSALLATLARGPVHGFNRETCREPGASRWYHQRHHVARQQHAIWRQRQLFADALDYPLTPQDPIDYGLSGSPWQRPQWAQMDTRPHVVWVTGTSWMVKKWPQTHWRLAAQQAEAAGFRVWITAAPDHRSDAKTIAQGLTCTQLTPPVGLTELAHLMATSHGVIAPDTGLGHLATALHVPTIGLFGPTSPALTGPLGDHTQVITPPPGICPHMPCLRQQCALSPEGTYSPCMHHITPLDAWHALLKRIDGK